MNGTRIALVGLVAACALAAWPKREVVVDTHRVARQLVIWRTLAQLDDPVVILGDSIVEASTSPRSLCGHAIVNAGIGGASTASQLGAFLSESLGNKRAALVVVSLGANDAAIPHSVEQYSSNYRALRRSSGLPAIAATLVAAAVMLMFGKPNVAAGDLSGSAWFASQWNTDVSIVSVIRDGTVNALFLGYRGLPGVAFLAPWQQPVEQSLVAPLWTLSIEFYGSMIVLALCWCARRSRAVVVDGRIARSGRSRSEAPISAFSSVICWPPSIAPKGPRRLASCCRCSPIMFGVFLCVLAEVWQPQWLRSLCADPTYFLFPGQFAPMQQKTFGAILVLVGIIDLQVARDFLSRPWLVARSKLSFPLYLIHWPILFGPAAALFLLLNGIVGIELARLAPSSSGSALPLSAACFFSASIAARLSCRENCEHACPKHPMKRRVRRRPVQIA